MGLPKFKTKISVEDYLESEKYSLVRREYVDGEVYAMAGASDNHNRISRNLITLLSAHLGNSELTQRVDTLEKVFAYQQISSLQEYVVVDQYRMEVRVHRRQENGGWITHYFIERSDIVEFTSIDL